MLHSSLTLTQQYLLLRNYILRILEAEYFEDEEFASGPLDESLEFF